MLFLDPNTRLFLKICFTGYFRLCSLLPHVLWGEPLYIPGVWSPAIQGRVRALLHCAKGVHTLVLSMNPFLGQRDCLISPNFRTTSLFQLWPHYKIPAEAHISSVHGLPSACSAIPAGLSQVRRGRPEEGMQSDQHHQWRMLFFLSQFYAYKNISS